MCTCIKGSRIPKTAHNFSPDGCFKPKRKSRIIFEREEIDKQCQKTTYTKMGVEDSNSDAISGLPRPLVTEVVYGRNFKHFKNSQTIADRLIQHMYTKRLFGSAS
jgi:hypothetical protein